jgi:hypothetical protein
MIGVNRLTFITLNGACRNLSLCATELIVCGDVALKPSQEELADRAGTRPHRLDPPI